LPAIAHPPRLKRTLRSFAFAFAGLATMARTQPNFVVHLAAMCLALGLGAVLGLSALEFAVLVVMIAVVLAAECVNTALEALCDVASPGYNPLVKRAKDVSAGAVLIAALASVVVAVLLFVPHLRR
jgi:diacylglycerol kinase (ATP)